ncbi:hypothetical protein K435DRAFT_874790 [Dendrothele bispora CBS 962.96]|uniref:Uncharacterized protein n=1 Tax=Dendrothele bispora (strain CBS 962.96) TaxID=1314807 RepID=A0A4S8KVS7_DENBC|nr:hypothetical protein K435DRAFT_874790 [Dendrothele bispora CBS 962.96]
MNRGSIWADLVELVENHYKSLRSSQFDSRPGGIRLTDHVIKRCVRVDAIGRTGGDCLEPVQEPDKVIVKDNCRDERKVGGGPETLKARFNTNLPQLFIRSDSGKQEDLRVVRRPGKHHEWKGIELLLIGKVTFSEEEGERVAIYHQRPEQPPQP